MTIKYFILILHSMLNSNINQCSNNPDTAKITVVGIAIVNKHQAAVRTDDSLIYYLDGIDDWDVEYIGKRVKVTGQLMKPGPVVTKNPNPEITTPPQPRLRDGIILTKAKWKLVKNKL